uniref:Uncharacterized protein n=1 Tax=Arundo donax TaxID=35708 RepID=A0A0A9FLG9_ARUDO
MLRSLKLPSSSRRLGRHGWWLHCTQRAVLILLLPTDVARHGWRTWQESKLMRRGDKTRRFGQETLNRG